MAMKISIMAHSCICSNIRGGKIGFHGSYKLQSPLATSAAVSAAAVAAAANYIYNCHMMTMAFSLLHAALSAPSPRNWSGPPTSPAWTVFLATLVALHFTPVSE